MNIKYKIALPIIAVCVFIIMAVNCIHVEQTNGQSTEATKVTDHNNTIESTEISSSTEPTEKPTEITTEPTNMVETETKNENINIINLGEFRLTAYCSCSKCCGQWALNRPVDKNGNEIICGSSGERLTAGVSVAVDTDIIPYGTEIIINGHKYIAHDTGSGIVGNCIDIYFDSHEEALNFGMQYAEVFMEVN